MAPAVLFSASDPETDIPKFLARVEEKEVDRVLTTCCEWAARSRTLGLDAQSPQIHSVNLKEECFCAHPDTSPAHGKASRLLRAVVETGLTSYGVNNVDLFRSVALYVDKVLKGAKPADLPVERPNSFEFVINLETAKQLGLSIPPSVFSRPTR